MWIKNYWRFAVWSRRLDSDASYGNNTHLRNLSSIQSRSLCSSDQGLDHVATLWRDRDIVAASSESGSAPHLEESDGPLVDSDIRHLDG